MPIIMLIMQLWQQTDRLLVKPPVTLALAWALVGVMVLIHLDPSVVPLLRRPFQDMCLQPGWLEGGWW